MAFPTTSLELRFEAKHETAYTDGQEATTVTDQSPNGYDMAGSGLTWESGELNGEAVYRFDGVDDTASDAAIGGSQVTAWSVAVVCKSDVEATSRLWPFVVHDSTTYIMGFTEGETASEWGVFARSDAATQKIFTSGVDTTQWAALLLVWDGATVSFYRDNSLVGSASLSGQFIHDEHAMGEFLTDAFDGDVALAAAWSKALDSTERSDLQDYIDSTYFGAGGVSQVIGQAVDTSTAQPLSAAKALVIGQAVETDLAQVVVAEKARTVGQAIETSTAQALVATKLLEIAQAIETDTAQPVSSPGQVSQQIGQALETDTAQPLTAAKLMAIAQAIESDVAQAITAEKAVQIGLATETSIAQALEAAKTYRIGQATETSVAIAVTHSGGLVVVHIEGNTYVVLEATGATAPLTDRGFAIAELDPSKTEI